MTNEPQPDLTPAAPIPVPLAGAPVRRPLRFRESKLAASLARRAAAAGLHPNAISVASALASLMAGAMLAASGQESGASAAVLSLGAITFIGLRGLCNVLGGMVAIEHGQRTNSGELFNELPDRFADVFILAGAGYGDPANVWLGWTAASLAVITAYVRALGGAMGAGQHFIGPMQKTHRMAVIAAAALIAGIASLSGRSPALVMRIALSVIAVGCLITIAIRCRRIFQITESR